MTDSVIQKEQVFSGGRTLGVSERCGEDTRAVTGGLGWLYFKPHQKKAPAPPLLYCHRCVLLSVVFLSC